MSGVKTLKNSNHRAHFCLFCKTTFKRIHQHFIKNHKDEDKIKAILLIKDKRQRNWEWKKLTQEGDFFFNMEIKDTMKAKKTVKKPRSRSTRKRYFDCPRCFGRMRTCSRSQHEKTCKEVLKKDVNVENTTQVEPFPNIPERLVNKLRRSLYVTKFLMHLFEERKNRCILRTAITDLIALEDGIQTAAGEKNKPLVKFLTPTYVDNFIKVIKSLGQERSRKKEKLFQFPHKAGRICRIICNLCRFLNIFYIKRELNEDAENCAKFLTIFETESTKFIKKQAYRSIKIKKLENHTKLPQTSDITFLIRKLEDEQLLLIEKLEKKKNPSSWRQLAENLLCQLTIFNRRRGGDVEKLTVDQYLCSDNAINSTTEEILHNLNKEDEEFLKNIRIVKIIHKCQNIPPIFIQRSQDEAMKLLLEYRKFGDINLKNEHFFAASKKSLNPIRGVKIIQKYRNLLPEQKRKMFTTTNLRKHGATTAKVLKLSREDKQEWVTHLGRTAKVHKDYSRCEQQINAILKTGRILTALNKGTLKYYKGKKIDDIAFDNPKGEEASTSDLSQSPVIKPLEADIVTEPPTTTSPTLSDFEKLKGEEASTSDLSQSPVIKPLEADIVTEPPTTTSPTLSDFEKLKVWRASFQNYSDSSENDNSSGGIINFENTCHESDSDGGDIAGIPRIAGPILLPKTTSILRLRDSNTLKRRHHKRTRTKYTPKK